MSNSRRIITEFFKVYLPQQSSERLLIPNAFVKFFNGSLPKNVVLSNQMGSSWPVKINFIDGEVFFLHGWQEFVRENSIECGDFLVFSYDGECGFSVKIFGNSAREERKAFFKDKEKLEEDKEYEEKDEVTKENDTNDEDYEDNYNEDDEDYIQEEEEEDSTEEEEEEEAAVKKSKSWKQSGGDVGGSKTRAAVKIQGGSKGINVVNVAEEEEKETTIRKSRDKQHGGASNEGSKERIAVKVGGGSKRNNVVNIQEEEEEEEESTIKTSRVRKQSCKNHGGSRKRPIVKFGGSERTLVTSEQIDVSKYIQPRNPHFFAKLRTGPQNDLLLVPSQVLKLHKLDLPDLMIFKNEHGRQWPGHTLHRRDGRTWIKGWSAFCKWNNVSLDDCCLCELLPGCNGQKGNTLKVWIIRNAGSGS